MEPRSKKQTSRASIPRSTETQRMSLQIGMKTVDLNSSIHTERQLMLGNQVIHCCQVVQLVFPLIDQLQLFTWVSNVASFYLLAPWISSMMTSLRRRTTKKFKMRFSDGFWMMKETWSQVSKMSQSWASTITYPTLLLLLIDFARASKSLMNFQKTSRLYSMRNCINSIQTWFQKPLIYTKHLMLSTNHLHWFHQISKLQCQRYKQQFSLHHWRNCLHLAWNFSTWTTNSPVRR